MGEETEVWRRSEVYIGTRESVDVDERRRRRETQCSLVCRAYACGPGM